MVLTHTTPAPDEPDGLLVLPDAAVAQVAGGTDDTVALDRTSHARGALSWHESGRPRAVPVERIIPNPTHEPPTPPALHPVPAALLTALHECGRTTAKESGRFALARVQVRGPSGHVIGTDGTVALVWAGFAFPFPGDVLVPAVPVFGADPLARAPVVRVGRTPTHLVVGAGPWAVWLPADTGARYPDVAGVIPADAPTVVTVHADDAALLRPVLRLPGRGRESHPVTLEAGRTVRVLDAHAGDLRPHDLACSTAAGPAVRVALDRRVLARALALGCRTLKLAPGRPVVAVGEHATLITAPLDPRPTVPAIEPPPPSPPERSPPMTPEPTGPAPIRGDPPDPLDLAEELRVALAGATATAARLVVALRHNKKEKRALATVLSGLKQLNLGDGGAR